MFICEKCLPLYRGLNLIGSFGPCEECEEVANCADLVNYKYIGPPREKQIATQEQGGPHDRR